MKAAGLERHGETDPLRAGVDVVETLATSLAELVRHSVVAEAYEKKPG